MLNTIVAAGPGIPRETVISLSRRLSSEVKTSLLYYQKIVMDGFDSHTVPQTLGDVSESFIISLYPKVLDALKVAGLEGKKQYGQTGLADQLCTRLSMSLPFLQQAGARVVKYQVVPGGEPIPDHFAWRMDYGDSPVNTDRLESNKTQVVVYTDPIDWNQRRKICFWVSGRNLLPVMQHWVEIDRFMPRGGPIGFQGIQMACTNFGEFSKLAESVRLACMCADYSGPIFLDVEVGKGVVVHNVSFRYPEGFMTAFLKLLNQSIYKFYYSLSKGTYFTPNFHFGHVVALQVITKSNELRNSGILDTPSPDYGPCYHAWTRKLCEDTAPTYIPDLAWDIDPEALVKLDGFYGIEGFVQDLNRLKCSLVGGKVEDGEQLVQPNNEEAVCTQV